MNRKKLIYILFSFIAVIVLGGGTYWYIQSRQSIPPRIKKQISFVILLPQGDQSVKIDRASFKYDSNLKVLTFVVTCFGIKNTVSEEAAPDAFNDIPGYYDKLIETLNGYSTFGTVIGNVSLTRPVEFHGDQSAVLNAKGTLLFAHPVKDLSDSQWREFFNSLNVIK